MADQSQQVTGQGLGLDQIADAVNRQKLGTQRQRNEMMRLGTSDPNSFVMNNQSQLQQAKQPVEFWGAGRKLAENQSVQSDEFGILDSHAPKLGGQRYYYGDTDWTSVDGLAKLYETTGYTKYKNSLIKPPQQQPQTAPVNQSIADLTTRITPAKPKYKTGIIGLFGNPGGDETYMMPERVEELRQQGLYQTIRQNNPKAFENLNPQEAILANGLFNKDYAAINRTALERSPMDDVTNAQVFGAYSPLAHQNDPTVKYLNSKYKFRNNQWELGDGKYYTPKKSWQGNDWYGYRGKTGNEEMDAPTFSQHIEKNWADSFTPDGAFNKEGWHVTKPNYDAIARRGIVGTLSVLAPAIFSGLSGASVAAGEGGAAAGASASIPAGSQGLMTGALATEAAPAAAGAGTNAGMFGNSNLNLGNSYLNAAGEGAVRGAVTSGGDPKAIATSTIGGVFGNVANNSSGMMQAATNAGLSPTLARALFTGTGGALSGLVSGKSGQQALQSGLGQGVGSYVGNAVQGLTKESLGEIISKISGGAASGGINSLFTGNNAVHGSLYGGMSGGLHGFLNSTAKDRNSLNAQTDLGNRRTAQGITKLVQMYNRKR